ncbi:DivIVA domain-containing protein [Phytohabitans flavus]|uniref:Cell wall synthesis protein Wag31 n=1 Tax=Phytohabitans flavus TaxID=1076124 RepID=A0A6F8XVB7_9ACTN|nr:DivIVA domain-containing protein [Phytohabitans flavus]BCB77681.1 cell division initiation protein [Phytohabitans flavus]
MPLTPADVHNVAFKKPPLGQRGFDEEEVDAFLDEVEQELVRLIEENNELRAQLERGGGGRLDPGPDRWLDAELDEVRNQLDRAQRDRAAAEQAARSAQMELERARSQGAMASGADSEQVARVLMMAQRTADDHLGDARREADGVLADARTRADDLTNEARASADTLERDARQRHQEAMGGLDAKRTATLRHIEELQQFERQYRGRLTAYIESQLRDHGGGEREAISGGRTGETALDI